MREYRCHDFVVLKSVTACAFSAIREASKWSIHGLRWYGRLVCVYGSDEVDVSGEPLSVLEVDMVGKVSSYVVVEESSCENFRLKSEVRQSRFCSDVA